MITRILNAFEWIADSWIDDLLGIVCLAIIIPSVLFLGEVLK